MNDPLDPAEPRTVPDRLDVDALLSQTQPADGATLPDARAGRGSLRDDGGLVAGLRIGRFSLLDRLGSGGMGVVWAAYDPQLDRKVALKFVRLDVGGGAGGDVLVRFAREAQAMARVNHPNVIAIHDTGQSGEQVYIAEEFVRGAELSAWLKEKPRAQPEILAIFLQAARGLRAAHEAGIVHRDFKPANVLVGEDGRVRVVDFGLARSTRDESAEVATARALASAPASDSPGAPASFPAAHEAALSSDLTRTGASIGTPFYMSPEQYQGKPSDARGDQFSFCVTLYEALYGEKPFQATTYYTLANRVVQGLLEPAPPKAKVPSHLREILLRGLQPKPEDRFPSMAELIAALERDPHAGRRKAWLLSGAALLALALAGLAVYQLHQRKLLCHGGDPAVASVWNPKRQAAARAAFLGTGLSFAPTVWASVERSLASYGRDWAAMHTEACEATRLRGEQSEEVLDLRMLCLSQHLQELKASTDLFVSADPQVVRKATQIASALSPVSECADVQALQSPVRPPRDAQTRAQVEEVRGRVAQAKSLAAGAKFPEALAIAEGAAASAAQIHYAPLQAEALFQQAKIQSRLRQDAPALRNLQDAFYAALASRSDALAVRAAIGLVGRTEGGHYADAHAWARAASALLERTGNRAADLGELHMAVGNLESDEDKYDAALDEMHLALGILQKQEPPDPLSVAWAHNNTGLVLWHLGKPDEALAEFQTALSLEEKELGPNHPEVADCLNNVGLIRASQNRPDEALASYRRALEIIETAFGPAHPQVADQLNNIGMAMMQQGKLDEALPEFQRALALKQKALGPEHLETAQAYNNLGVLLWRQGKFDDALVQMRHALAIRASERGAEHPSLGDAHLNIGAVLCEQGKYDDALIEMQRGLELHTRGFGPDHPTVATDRNNIGNVLNLENRYDEAMVQFREALAIQVKAIGVDEPPTAVTEGNVGEVEVKQRAYGPAIEHLTHALSVMEAKAPDPSTLGEFSFALAQARWGANEDRPKALALAQQARGRYASLSGHAKELAEIDAWIKSHAPRS